MLVTTQHKDHVFEITLNRPDKRNAINLAMMEALETAITQAEKAKGARVIILQGEGKGFSGGIDLMGFPELVERFGDNWQHNLFPATEYMQGVFNRVERSSLPVIALLHGFCIGMGFELAMACDLRIAAEGTKLGLPETRLGLIPDVGGTTRLTRLVGPGRAKELIMTGRTFDTEDAERWGLINHVVSAYDLQEKAQELAAELAVAAPLAVSYAKKVIDAIADIDRGLKLEAWAQSVLIRTEDFTNGAQAMMMKQPIQWQGK